MTAQERAQKAIELRGYLVIHPNWRYELPCRIPAIQYKNERVMHPFVVVQETNKEDYEEQCLMLGSDVCVGPRDVYYRVVTD